MVAAVAGVVAGLCALAVVADARPVRDAVGTAVVLEATADSDAAPGVAGPTEGLWRVELAVDRVDGVAVRARVTAWGDEPWSEVARGERLVVEARLSAADGEDALAWRPVLRERSAPQGLHAASELLRSGLRDATSSLPERLRPLARGMVIGDDAGMPREQRLQMARAGLTHLTAVSGAHFAIVLIAVTVVLRLVLRNRRVAAAVSGAVMGMLVVVVFPEPSVVRAATMASAMCTALWWGRPAQSLPALCCGVTGVAIVDPRLAVEPGFAMSVAAVAAIALWAPALAMRLAPHVTPVLAHPLAVCIAAQGAVMPLLAMIGGEVGPWSVAANLAVGWCAAPVTLIGLAALVMDPFSAETAVALATVSGWCAWPVDAAARAADRLPFADLTVPPGPWGAAASAVVVGVFAALTFAARVRLGLLTAAAVGALVLASVPWGLALFAPRAPGDWLVVACDVGQGDAMLLRSAESSAVMIDTGTADGRAVECLRRYGVTRVDLLIITHPHADHDGAAAQVAARMPVMEAWVSARQSEDGGDVIAALAARGVPLRAVSQGTTAAVGAVNVTVLAPGAQGAQSMGVNDASLVTHATVAGVSVLALGDLEHEGQRSLASSMGAVVVDVVKLPHHGSDRQDPQLASRVTARLAVVSVGAGNSYGHPSPDALDLWGERAGELLRTDLCGDIVVVAGPAVATSCPMNMAG